MISDMVRSQIFRFSSCSSGFKFTSQNIILSSKTLPLSIYKGFSLKSIRERLKRDYDDS